MKKFLPLAILLAFALSSCGGEAYYPAEPEPPPVTEVEEAPPVVPEPENTGPEFMNLQYALAIANIRRENFHAPSREMLESLAVGRVPRTIEVLETFFTRDDQEEIIPTADAVSDAQLFFATMREIYGGYTYFGGDAVFLPVFDRILDILSDAEYWYLDDFGLVLYENLSPYITDNHFHINGRVFRASADIFTPGLGAAFDRTENGFRDRSNNLYVYEVPGHDISTLFRLSLDMSGQFYYTPVVIIPGTENPGVIFITLVYTCGTEQRMSLSRRNYTRLGWQNVSLHTEAENIPVVTIRQMDFDHPEWGQYEDARRFLSLAEQLRDEPVIIVDARSNGGGNGLLARQFLHILTGELVPQNFVSLHTNSYEDLTRQVNDPESAGGLISAEVAETYNPFVPIGNLTAFYFPDRLIENDRLIILLVDRFSASAAEGFADLLLNVENTLIIGQNTAGALNFDAISTNLRLPLSGLHFMLGHTVMIHPEGSLIEGRGIAPDIWTHGDALIAAVAMLREKGDF